MKKNVKVNVKKNMVCPIRVSRKAMRYVCVYPDRPVCESTTVYAREKELRFS